jgi:hypothetical protein
MKLLMNTYRSYAVSAQHLDKAFLLRFGVDAHKENIAHSERHVALRKQLRPYAEQTLRALREHISAAHMLLYVAADAR